MALASAGLSVTFQFRAGPASAELEAMNATDLLKGMPSMDLKVGHLNAKKLQLCAKKEVELPSVGLQASLLLSCFLFTLSYGAGYFSLKRNNGAGSIYKMP